MLREWIANSYNNKFQQPLRAQLCCARVLLPDDVRKFRKQNFRRQQLLVSSVMQLGSRYR